MVKMERKFSIVNPLAAIASEDIGYFSLTKYSTAFELFWLYIFTLKYPPAVTMLAYW